MYIYWLQRCATHAVKNRASSMYIPFSYRDLFLDKRSGLRHQGAGDGGYVADPGLDSRGTG